MATVSIQAVPQDEIHVRGIRCKGFGQLPKIVMLCSSLKPEAKGIYAYFCSYTGSGNAVFPSRDRIIHDLHLNKDTYYKHFKSLTQTGLITVEQKTGDATGAGFKHNIYTIENLPEEFLALCETDASAAMTASLDKIRKAGDLSAAGYGNIPKAVMTDEISIQAKALYAYLSVFTGENYLAAPSRDVVLYHMAISHNSYNKYTKELLEKDYLRKTQSVNGGRFAEIVYYLNPLPGAEEKNDVFAQPKISDTCISDSQISDTCKSDAQNPDTVVSDALISDPQKSDLNSPKRNTTRTNIRKINQSQIQQVSPAEHTDNGKETATDGTIDFDTQKFEIESEILTEKAIPYSYTEDLPRMTGAIRVLTGWDARKNLNAFAGENPEEQQKVYRLFVDCLAEMLTVGQPTKVKGGVISYAKAYEKLMENSFRLEQDELGETFADLGQLPEQVIGSFLRASRKTSLTNVRSYLKTIIWTELQEQGLWGIAQTELLMNNEKV